MKILCTRRQARAIGGQLITSGSVGIEVDFEFSEDWAGTSKIAVFSGSGVTKDVVLAGTSCVIPHEVLARHGGHAVVGVYGYVEEDGVKTVVIPTVYADLGRIERGADPSGDESLPETATVAEQVIAIAASVRADADAGKFDGKDGRTPIKGVDYFDGKDGSDYTITSADYAAIAERTAELVPQYDDSEIRQDIADLEAAMDGKADKSEIPAVPVQDVTINGTSIVDGGVAEVPKATNSNDGVVKLSNAFYVSGAGQLNLVQANTTQISNRNTGNALTPNNLDASVKAAMCDGNGEAWTDAEKAAARARIGLGDYELLNRIELAEAVAELILSNADDGTAYSLRNVIAEINTPAGSYPGGVVYCRADSATNFSSAYSTITARANNASRVRFEADTVGGIMSVRSTVSTTIYGNIESGSTDSVALNSNPSVKISGVITSLRFYTASGVHIPVGSIIKIYGVRA